MDAHHHDKVFIVTFLGVLAFLGAFTVAIIVIANVIYDPKEEDPDALARIEARIAPAGTVVTDPDALLKVSAPAAAKREPMSGTEIVAKVCNACHGTGVLEAPRNHDKAAWGPRLAAAGGLDGLVQSAIKGKNAMPPKGGDPSLSETEVRAAVKEMLP